MDSSGSGGGKVFGRFTEQAHRVLDLARAEAERAGHRYLGPEHVLLGLLAEGHSRAAQVLWAAGVDLAAARPALAGLADQGVVPAPRPSDTELLGTLGIDLEAVRRDTEHAFGVQLSGRRPGGSPDGAGGGAQGWCGRRCAGRRWSPSGPCSWPASTPKRWARTRSALSICSWGSWTMRASRRTHAGLAAASADHRPCRPARRLSGRGRLAAGCPRDRR